MPYAKLPFETVRAGGTYVYLFAMIGVMQETYSNALFWVRPVRSYLRSEERRQDLPPCFSQRTHKQTCESSASLQIALAGQLTLQKHIHGAFVAFFLPHSDPPLRGQCVGTDSAHTTRQASSWTWANATANVLVVLCQSCPACALLYQCEVCILQFN